MANLDFLKKMDKNKALLGVALVGIVVTAFLIFADSGKGFSFSSLNLGFGGLSNEAVAQKAVDYINNNNLSQTPASFVAVSSEAGLVKIKIKIGTSEFDSYATKDGSLLFPQAFKMNGETDNQNANNNTGPTEEEKKQAAAAITKVDSPMLEAYVVSRCPFGLQMQRAMAEAVRAQPSLGQYMKVRYIGSVSADGKTITAMHGEAEATENLRQICIREEQPNKYWEYTACQMKAAGTEASCEKSTGVDSAKLSSCMSTPSKGVAYAKQDFDLNAKFNVSGSPTMILNEALASESSFGGRSADAIKAMICAGSKNEPSFCSTALNTAEAAVSFSAEYAGAGGSGNSGANGAGCAPAS